MLQPLERFFSVKLQLAMVCTSSSYGVRSYKDKAVQTAFYNAIIYFNTHHHALNRESQHIRA